MPKLSYKKNCSGTIKPIAWRISELIRFYPKVNVIECLEFEHANYESATHSFNHYTPSYRQMKWTR